MSDVTLMLNQSSVDAGFMDQRCGLQSMTSGFTGHFACREFAQLAQLAINQWQQSLRTLQVRLRLSRENHPAWKNREQFYAVAAEVMRRILVDRAEQRLSQKRGGELIRVELDAVEFPIPKDDTLLLRVHEALGRLELEDREKAEVVKLRFFVGLDRAEVAAMLGISERTVQRHWTFAKAWLFREMRSQT